MNREELIARQQQIVDAARSAGRDLSAVEQQEFDALQRQLDQPPQDPSDEAIRTLQEERQRTHDIMEIGNQTGLDVHGYIRDGSTIDQVRQAAIAHMVANGAPIAARTSDDDTDDFRRDATEALLMMTGTKVENPTEGAQALRGMGLRDLAIESMVRDGLGTTTSLLRMGKGDLFDMAQRQFYNPTSAFPAILDNTIKKALVQQYQAVPTTFQQWTSKGSLSDFKATKEHNYLAGGAGEFLRVGENGELKADKPSTELLPQRKIDTYGRSFSMSRQAFINDDIGFITEVPSLYATAAKRTINKQVYSILVNNPAIYDGVTLFNQAHNNLMTTGCAPSGDAMQAMMMQMLLQKDQFGESIMVQPHTVIVPVGYKFLMTSILFSPTINTTDNTQAVNPLYDYRNNLNIVEDATINALAGSNPAPWFMVADGTSAKSIQVDYLNGQETPIVRRSERAGQLGYVWDIYLDWGVTVLDYRGINRNDGVAL